jgi:hypothetical protein
MLERVQVERARSRGTGVEKGHTMQWPYRALECALGRQAIPRFARTDRWNVDCALLTARACTSCPSRWSAGQDGAGAGDSAAARWHEHERQHDISGLPSFQKETKRAGCIQRQSKCCACVRRQLGWNWPARRSSRGVVRYTYR